MEDFTKYLDSDSDESVKPLKNNVKISAESSQKSAKCEFSEIIEIGAKFSNSIKSSKSLEFDLPFEKRETVILT